MNEYASDHTYIEMQFSLYFISNPLWLDKNMLRYCNKFATRQTTINSLDYLQQTTFSECINKSAINCPVIPCWTIFYVFYAQTRALLDENAGLCSSTRTTKFSRATGPHLTSGHTGFTDAVVPVVSNVCEAIAELRLHSDALKVFDYATRGILSSWYWQNYQY